MIGATLIRLPAVLLLGLLVLPVVALVWSASLADLAAGAQHPLFAPALSLSLRTSVASLGMVLLTGTPLAWWLANTSGRTAQVLEALIDLPIVLPPAVVGIALLQTFGRNGLFGPALSAAGLQVPFTTWAVMIAQVVVSAPFYVQSAAAAFRAVDPDLILVARTLGASAPRAFVRVAIPLALPGLVGGAALCWARALGEFGATLLFAGNLSGTSQTMPLAIVVALEDDVRAALALSLVLAGVAIALLIGLRGLRLR